MFYSCFNQGPKILNKIHSLKKNKRKTTNEEGREGWGANFQIMRQ